MLAFFPAHTNSPTCTSYIMTPDMKNPTPAQQALLEESDWGLAISPLAWSPNGQKTKPLWQNKQRGFAIHRRGAIKDAGMSLWEAPAARKTHEAPFIPESLAAWREGRYLVCLHLFFSPLQCPDDLAHANSTTLVACINAPSQLSACTSSIRLQQRFG